MQNTAVFNTASLCGRIQAFGFRFGKSVQHSVNRRVSVRMHTYGPAFPQALFYSRLQFVCFDVCHAGAVGIDKGLALQARASLIGAV